MKKIFFLIFFTLQFCSLSYSQSDQLHHYSDAEIIKLSEYVRGLELKKSSQDLSESEKKEKIIIDEYFERTPHAYSDVEVIKLADYIRRLENPELFAANSADVSTTHYENSEIEKFTNYINKLESKIPAAGLAQIDPEERNKINELLNNPTHDYTDKEVIKLADYIKHLEKLESIAVDTPAVVLTSYNITEKEKFALYIYKLETRIPEVTLAKIEPEEKAKITKLLNSASSEFTDSEIVSIANYIKKLEKLDSSAGNTITDSLTFYTQQEIDKLLYYTRKQEMKIMESHLVQFDPEDKLKIMDIINKFSKGFNNLEIIAIADYIKQLENLVSQIPAIVKSDEEIIEKVNTNEIAQPDENTIVKVSEITKVKTEEEPIVDYKTEDIIKSEDTKVKIKELDTSLSDDTKLSDEKEIVKEKEVVEEKEVEKEVVEEKEVVKEIAKTIVKEKEKEKEKVAFKEYHLDEESQINKIEKLIYFNFDKSSLKQESYKPLEDVAKILRSYVNLNFIVEGYCDSVGSAVYNLGLSNRRAGAVKGYFISKGIAASRISAIGYGEENPADTNKTEQGRANNRRVAIKAKRQ